MKSISHGKRPFYLCRDIIRMLIAQPLSATVTFDEQVIGDVPTNSRSYIPSEVRFGIVVMMVVMIVVVVVVVTLVKLHVLVTDTCGDKWSDPPIDDVVIEVKAAGMEEAIVTQFKPLAIGGLTVKSRRAEQKVTMNREEVTEMAGDPKPSHAGIIDSQLKGTVRS